MASDNEQNAREEVRKLLRNISDAWTKGRPEELEEYFREEMVISGPGFKGRGRGNFYRGYSYRRDSTGLAAAAFAARKIVVRPAMMKDKIPAKKKYCGPTEIR